MSPLPIDVSPDPMPGTTSWRQTRTALVATVLARTVLGALVLLVLVTVLPAVAGWQSTVVLSGSMVPGVQPGDVAVVRPVDTDRLQPGQVLLVDDPDLPGALRLHRLVAIEDGGLRLQGDANPQPDGSLVSPSAVHGVGTLRLPGLGLPVLWAAEGRWLPVAGTAFGLAGLIGLAVLHRSSSAAPAGGPADPTQRTGADTPPRRRPMSRRVRRAARGGLALGAVGLLVTGLPGTSGAVFTASTANHVNTFSVERPPTCTSVASAAPGYFGFQEAGGTVARNSGTAGSYVNGTYSGGPTPVTSGPPKCAPDGTRAMRFDGVDDQMYTSYAMADPQTFTVQLWFATTAWNGGKLIGFGTGANGSASGQHDRHVYMTNSGKLTFGVYSGAVETVTTERSYNDGAWHLMTATFSPTTGLRLYVDGVLQKERRSTTSAEPYTGYWRVGYDTISASWPAEPRSDHFAGSIAHVSLYLSVLTPDEVARQYAVGG
ncbi:LamG-like jellyroll fold domain-containing protein [Modestobacter italicus]|uniref:LamG-like jellyroll fold domain-containing protein n=1 Tax=Modestobacter italicus (strain DSM 44449 / CECT 9708 / BC 501) TaxID=2732864 RepID=UPI001C96983F|nr:LamG-like jellyroll fold domain-containing protein [Modestobacter italicus]